MRSTVTCLLLAHLVVGCGKSGEDAASPAAPPSKPPPSPVWHNMGNARALPACIGDRCKAFFITGLTQDFELRDGKPVSIGEQMKYVGGAPLSVASGPQYAVVAGLWGSVAFDSSWNVGLLKPAANAAVASVPGGQGYYLVSARYATSGGLHVEAVDATGQVVQAGGVLGAGKDEQYACAPLPDGVAAVETVLGAPRQFALVARRFIALSSTMMRTELVVKVYAYSAGGPSAFTEVAGFTLATQTGLRGLSCADLYSLKEGPRSLGVYPFDNSFAVAWHDGRRVLLRMVRHTGNAFQLAAANVAYDILGTVFGSAPDGQLVVVVPDNGNDFTHVSYVTAEGNPGRYRSLDQRTSWVSLGDYGQKMLVLFSPLGADKKSLGLISATLFE